LQAAIFSQKESFLCQSVVVMLLLCSVGSQWTYTHHKKPLQSIGFVESVRLVSSTDGSLHVRFTELINHLFYQL